MDVHKDKRGQSGEQDWRNHHFTVATEIFISIENIVIPSLITLGAYFI